MSDKRATRSAKAGKEDKEIEIKAVAPAAAAAAPAAAAVETKEPVRKKRKSDADIEAMIDLMDGQFDNPEFLPRAKKVRRILAQAERDVWDVIAEETLKGSIGGRYDKQTVKRALHKMQSAKDTFCIAMLLPYAPSSLEAAKAMQDAART